MKQKIAACESNLIMVMVVLRHSLQSIVYLRAPLSAIFSPENLEI